MTAQLHNMKDDPLTLKAMLEFNQAFEEAGDSVNSPKWKNLATEYDKRFKDIKSDNEWYGHALC